MAGTPIYLDYQATTPLDERVLDAMMPYLTDKFGNPHSSTHRYGWEAEVALDVAREQVAALIGAKAEEITFTSGATETNNMVIKGVMDVWGTKRPHLVTVVTEHKCVLESAAACARLGFEVSYLPVKPDGLLDLGLLEKTVTEKTALVSVMGVNNEIGVIQPLKEIGAIAKAKGALFHSDIAQAYGKILLDVDDLQLDFASISGHKIYGPKGVGAFYKREGRNTALTPLMSGGGQERGLRSGTQAPALVAGLGKAAQLCAQLREEEALRISQFMTVFKARLFDALPGILVNGHESKRWQGNLNLSFPGLDGDLLLAELRSLALSSGAACASATEGPSYVLQALGRTDLETKAAIRIGVGRFTTEEEMAFAAEQIIEAVQRLGGLKV